MNQQQTTNRREPTPVQPRQRAHRRPRSPRLRLVGMLGAAALAAVSATVGLPATPAQAIPPFPVEDPTSGTPGGVNPNWERQLSNNTDGNTYTSDGWLRLTSNGTSQATNILNTTPFPGTSGFEVQFDYRMAGGTQFNGETGDGMAMYLVDGSIPISNGGPGSGLGYARANPACGVRGGYFGLGLDVFGNFQSPSFGSSGGGSLGSPIIGMRGSGPGDCTGAANTQYPWVSGARVPGLWTGTSADTTDPASQADSLYRRVKVRVVPNGGAVQVTASITPATQKSNPPGAFSEIFSSNLSAVPGQVPLPSSLRLGFSASTGSATDFHDIRNIDVRGLTDAAITNTLSPTTPGHSGYPAGTFLPGDQISFDLKATNNGPTDIGNAPNGVAVAAANLSSLPLTNVTWDCAAGAGAACITPGGTGSVVSQEWTGLDGSSITMRVHGTVEGPQGSYTASAVIPTDFSNLTVNPLSSSIQRDGGAADTDLTNNTATAGFVVAGPHFTQTKTADKTAYEVGQPITYTVTVANDGNGPGTATLADTVPAAVTVSKVNCAGQNGADCTVSRTGNDVSGTATTPAGSSVAVTIEGTVTATGSVANTATVTPTTVGCGPECGGGAATTGPIDAVRPAPSPFMSAIAASPGSITADGVSTSQVTVTLKDAAGSPVGMGGDTVTFSTSAGSLGPVTDNGDGTYTATLTSPQQPAVATVSFTVNGVAASATATVQFVAGSVDAANSQLVHSTGTRVADGADVHTATVTARDAHGNTVSNVVVDFAVAGAAGSGQATTDENGVASIQITSLSAGSKDVSATIGGQAVPGAGAVTFVAGPASASSSNLAVSTGEVEANGTDTHTATVVVRDANGNVVEGVEVTFSVADGATLSSETAMSDSQGVASVTITSRSAGTYEVSASIGGTEVTDSPQKATFVAGPPSLSASTIEASESSIPADGTAKSTITVRLVDAHGNTLTSGGSTVVITSDKGTVGATTDNGDGTYTAELTGATAGTATLSFTIDGEPATATTTVTLTDATVAAPPQVATSEVKLAKTGSEIAVPLLAAVASLAIGLLLAASRRRTRRP